MGAAGAANPYFELPGKLRGFRRSHSLFPRRSRADYAGHVTATPSRDRFEGCLLGLALGDALGAPHEGGPLERLLWRAIGTTGGRMRWTDDTQMALDVAESLVARRAVDPADLARRFADGYRWSRGYGPGTAQVLRRIGRGMDWREAARSVHPHGSYGNGGAMRAPVVGLFWCTRRGELATAARAVAAVTHAHPLGIEGALLLAHAGADAVLGLDAAALLASCTTLGLSPPFAERLEVARAWTETGAAPTAPEVRDRLGNDVSALGSCVSALYVATRFLRASFADMHAFAVAMGGDVDTIAAMAGALWGAGNGAAALPQAELARVEQLPRLRATAAALHAAMP